LAPALVRAAARPHERRPRFWSTTHHRRSPRPAAIDLEFSLSRPAGPGCVRKEFRDRFVFVVQTAARAFYLVAKTEEEMQLWVRSISQVCNLGHVEDRAGNLEQMLFEKSCLSQYEPFNWEMICPADSMESLSRTASSVQPSPASALHTRDDPSSSTVATEETGSESEFLFLPDYLILSNCETGRLRHASLPTRRESWSNSDRSLEQMSSDDVFVDSLQPLPLSSLMFRSRQGSGPQAALVWTRDTNGPPSDHFSLPLLETSLKASIQVEKNQGSLPYGVKDQDVLAHTPPPRPPKPSHLSERRLDEQLVWSGRSSIEKPECTMVPRRISLSGLDNMRTWK
ncbi:GRB2-associated-binding protein 3, partial [Camelus dromedarius]